MVTAPRRMGYWTDNPTDAKAASDEVLARKAPMAPVERDACLRYMANAREHQAWRGWASCRVAGCGAGTKNGFTMLGTRCMVTPDGKWVFPEKWEHYITEHGIRPDDDFVKDAVAWAQTTAARTGLSPAPKRSRAPYSLILTCSACGKTQAVIADPKKEVRELAVLADWTPGIKVPDDPKDKTWPDAVLCLECAADPTTAKRLDFHVDHEAF